MANEDIDRLSWLAGTEVLRLYDSDRLATVTCFDLSTMPEIPKSDGDITYRVQSSDRIDKLANARYGSPKYWWVIALANNIDLPSYELVAGQAVLLPDPATIQSLIGRR